MSAAEERLRYKAEALLRKASPTGRIVHELVMDRGSNRLDLASVEVDRIVAVEIKSDVDVLDRLADQLTTAHRCAHQVWVVSGVRHADSVHDRLKSLGSPCCHTAHYFETSELGPLEVYRWRHPYRDQPPDPRSLARLLWVAEWQEALAAAGFKPDTAHDRLCRQAIEELTGRDLRRWVCAHLRARRFPRADAPIAIQLEQRPGGWKQPAQERLV